MSAQAEDKENRRVAKFSTKALEGAGDTQWFRKHEGKKRGLSKERKGSLSGKGASLVDRYAGAREGGSRRWERVKGFKLNDWK